MFLLPSGAYLCGQHVGVFCSRIAQGAQQPGLLETNDVKLGQEGPTFLGPGNSGEPIGFIRQSFGGQRFTQNKLRGVDEPIRSDHTS